MWLLYTNEETFTPRRRTLPRSRSQIQGIDWFTSASDERNRLQNLGGTRQERFDDEQMGTHCFPQEACDRQARKKTPETRIFRQKRQIRLCEAQRSSQSFGEEIAFQNRQNTLNPGWATYRMGDLPDGRPTGWATYRVGDLPEKPFGR